MKTLPDRLSSRKNRFHYSLYCLVGFVLVSIKDVMKLLDDNLQETESATVPQLWGPEPSPLSEPQGQTQMNVSLYFAVATPCWLKQNNKKREKYQFFFLTNSLLVIAHDESGLAE